MVGLYLNPPEHALVLSCDEKSQIQALNRTQPGLPMKRGRAGTVTHDYKRHGTTTLFAALNTLDGTVISMCQPRHRHDEWLKFLRLIERKTPKHLTLHLIVDNYATHTHPDVQEWLAKHPRFVMHFTPTSASWLNMVERFFRDISENRIRRDSFTSVAELELAIDLYVAASQHRSQAVHLDRQRHRHPGQGHAGQGRPGSQRRISTEQIGAPHLDATARGATPSSAAAVPPFEPILEAAGDHAEHTGQLDLHRYRGVEHVDDTADGLTHRRDAEDEPVAVPAFAAGAVAAGQQVDDLRETGLDAAARLSAAELVWDADGDRCRHAPEGAAKRSTVQAACP